MDENGYTSTTADSSVEAAPDEIDGGVASCIKRSGSEDFADKFAKELNIRKSEKYAEFYSTDYKFNGYLMIFAHSTFTVGNKYDRGSVVEDIEMLKKTFSKLNFKIALYVDLKLQELKSVIAGAASKNYDDYGTLAVAVSSHGDDDGSIFAKDGIYDPNVTLFDPFKNVESLYGKPKMFFLEFCRGKSLDGGATLHSQVDTDGFLLEEFVIPREADMLIVYATVEGYVAFNNDLYGSQFFIYLTEALDEMAAKEDILTILTIANQRLSINFTSNNYKKPQYDKMKQCMCVMHTLTRRLLFRV